MLISPNQVLWTSMEEFIHGREADYRNDWLFYIWFEDMFLQLRLCVNNKFACLMLRDES